MHADNVFLQLFWPGDHAGSANLFGRQCLWICLFLASVWGLLLLRQGHPIAALIAFAFYTLGAAGVRQHSLLAATLVAAAYWIEQALYLLHGRTPGVLWIAIGLLLLTNIRGTWIVSRRQTPPQARRFLGKLPPLLWPHGRVPFYGLAAAYVTLLLLGTVAVSARRTTVARLAPTPILQAVPTR